MPEYAAAKDLPAFAGTCDRPDGIYQAGEKVLFTVSRIATQDSDATVKILRNATELVQTETFGTNEKSCALTFAPPSPDWFVCSVATPANKKRDEIVGAIVNPFDIHPSAPMPSDFDAFWQAQKARLVAEKPEITITPLTDAQRAVEGQTPDLQKRIQALEAEGYAGDNLEISCLDVKPMRGYLAQPREPKKGGRPAILFFHAAGVDAIWCRSDYANALTLAKRFDAIVLDINAHGMLNGQPQDYYTALAKGELASYQTQGRESRDTFYFLGMFLRLQRAVDFLCAMPEWDGKHLVCTGISQGGAQALAAAGLDSRVTAVVAMAPGNCDITGRLALRPSSWPGIGNGKLDDEETKKILETVKYFDNVNFCARSKAETLVTVGLIDTTCPAPGVFAAYNRLQRPKQIICLPAGSHSGLSRPTHEIQARYNDFIKKHTSDAP